MTPPPDFCEICQNAVPEVRRCILHLTQDDGQHRRTAFCSPRCLALWAAAAHWIAAGKRADDAWQLASLEALAREWSRMPGASGKPPTRPRRRRPPPVG